MGIDGIVFHILSLRLSGKGLYKKVRRSGLNASSAKMFHQQPSKSSS
jgi:hypothetical protein